MSLVMLCFPCCDEEQPPQRRRPKIDRTMIGEPMGFKHTGHIGSGEVSSGFDIHNVQDQMQSKGGYEFNCALSDVTPDGVNLKKTSDSEDDAEDKSTKKDDEQNGPTDQQNGPTDQQNGPTDQQNGTTDQQNGTTDQQNGTTTEAATEPNRTEDVSNQL